MQLLKIETTGYGYIGMAHSSPPYLEDIVVDSKKEMKNMENFTPTATT
jgi:hypothetical protein